VHPIVCLTSNILSKKGLKEFESREIQACELKKESQLLSIQYITLFLFKQLSLFVCSGTRRSALSSMFHYETAPGGARIDDPRITSPLLYRLSYNGTVKQRLDIDTIVCIYIV